VRPARGVAEERADPLALVEEAEAIASVYESSRRGTRVQLANYPRVLLQDIVGDAFIVEPEVDFERDVLDRLSREQLIKARSHLSGIDADLERRCCLRLESSNPSPEDWLQLAQAMDAEISARARAHLITHDPSVDALEYLVLAGSSEYKEEAAELILARQPPHADLLRCVLYTFKTGPISERAWRVLDTLSPDVDLLTHVLKSMREPAIAREAWERVAAQSPTEGDVSHILVFAPDPGVREQAADHLLRSGLDDLDRLSYVLSKSPNPAHRDEAARRILAKRRKKPKGDHLGDIVLHATDRELIERAWRAFAALRFTALKRDQWNLINLRNIVCSASVPEIRAEAFELAKKAPLDADDREYIAKHAEDAAVREAFA
jgi:hypothetical protein